VIVSIHQLAYLPWIGYFHKIRGADLFIYLDTVQFQKNSFQNRNKVRTQSGPIWLTVPVKTRGVLYDTPLKDLLIDDRQRWQAKHRNTLRMNYSHSPMFPSIFPRLEHFYQQPWERLSDLCWEMMLEFNDMLGIKTRIVKASLLGDMDGSKSSLVLNLCRSVGATTYLSGSLGRDYLELDAFASAGIDVVFQNFEHPTYAQHYPGFEPFMGVVDLLFCEEWPERFIGDQHASG
jgi:hypothetical protein